MTPVIYPLNELPAEHQSLAGGKAGTLARLYQAGYSVPDGFVILPPAFEDDSLTPLAWTEIQTQLNRLRRVGQQPAFAVRSSARSEDTICASFAGEFETVLNIHSDVEIRQAIQSVRSSRHAARVRAYSSVQGLDTVQDMAVIVQRLVPADFSGVLFTADPVTGSRAQMTGSFVTGLGERLVSGQDSGNPFTLGVPRRIWSGVTYSGPPQLKRAAARLYKLGRRLEQELGGPQDIEWAIAQGQLFLLQARPITTLTSYKPLTGFWNDSLSGDYLWSNVNFGEAVSEIMTPLSWTVLNFIFGQWKILPGYQSAGNIGGRPYLNISLFATVFDAMGRSREAFLDTLAGTMALPIPDGMEIPLLPISRWSVLTALPQLIQTRLKEKRALNSLPAYLAGNAARCDQLRLEIDQAQTRSSLLTVWREAIRPHLISSVWQVMGSVSHYADHTIRLHRDLCQLVGPDDADALISNLSRSDRPETGTGLLASLGPLVGLARVARGEMNRETYLAEYGHRGPNEFELSVPRPAEDPAWLERQLAQLDRSVLNVEVLLAKQRAEFEAAWQRLAARHPHQAKSLRRRIEQVAPRAQMREAARSEYTRDRWLMRSFALRSGQLTGLGGDVFFLTLDELLAVLEGDGAAIPTIPARRQTYEGAKALPPYPTIIRGRFDPYKWAADPTRRSDIFDASVPPQPLDMASPALTTITGFPGSAGRVEGLVRRLDNPELGHQLRPGEVLVTVQTDIAWTPLFPRAAAIVTDVGAPLSHAAIIARELGIPAVVGCGSATMRLQNGDRIRVDGGRGLVEVLNPNGSSRRTGS